MITLAMASRVGAPRSTVWRALAEPEQMLHWRPGFLRLLEAPAEEELAPGCLLRLRCRLHDVPVLLEERALEVVRGKRLRIQVRLGLFRCEALYTLSDANPGSAGTRVGLRIATASETPLLGGSLDRFAVRRFATQLASNQLAALRSWCEQHATVARPSDPLASAAAAR